MFFYNSGGDGSSSSFGNESVSSPINSSSSDSSSSSSSSETESVSSPSSISSLSGFDTDSSTSTSSSSTTSNESYEEITFDISIPHSREGSDNHYLTVTRTREVPLDANGDKIFLSSINSRNRRFRQFLQANQDDFDGDNGLACSVCLKNCEISGEHRLSSLKCGHFFGDSCLRQRLQENARQSGKQVCPDCGIKAHPRDIRYLYAKRLRVLDQSEELRMKEQLDQERSKNQILEFELDTMKMSYAQVTQKMHSLEADNESLKALLIRDGNDVSTSYYNTAMNKVENKTPTNCVNYRLIFDNKIAICRKPCCRVMKYADRQSKLIVSQKGFFPGYGLRIMDAPTFEASNYLLTSHKMVCDMSLSHDQNLIAVVSTERSSKLIDMRNFQTVTTFKPSKIPLLSCAIAHNETEYNLYLGSQQGSTYVYDTRYPKSFLDEHKTEADFSAVIQIESVHKNEVFPCGGFIVCKAASLWFYENIQDGGVNATRLTLEGSLMSINYNKESQNLLVQTTSCQSQPRARHILGKLNKIGCMPVFEITVIFFALTNSAVTSRSTQIDVDSNVLIAAYVQDKQLISVYDTSSEQCIQTTYHVPRHIYDTCPIYTYDFTYLAALNQSKCLLYKITSTS